MRAEGSPDRHLCLCRRHLPRPCGRRPARLPARLKRQPTGFRKRCRQHSPSRSRRFGKFPSGHARRQNFLGGRASQRILLGRSRKRHCRGPCRRAGRNRGKRLQRQERDLHPHRHDNNRHRAWRGALLPSTQSCIFSAPKRRLCPTFRPSAPKEPLSYVDSGMTIKVKDITGTKYTDAVLKYGSIYNLSVSEKKYSTNYAAGEIMEQSVAAGTDVPADKKPTLPSSSASDPPPSPFPTFRAKAMREAAPSLFPSLLPRQHQQGGKIFRFG